MNLTEHAEMELKIAGFDGNGHTITIKSFDYSSIASASSDGTGYFGLFKEVYADAIVKNLTVRYEIDGSVDLTEFEIEKDKYYTEIYFGGIASINNSIITNCVVEGKLNLTATRLNPSRFYLAGITCENRKTGYITNTTSKVSLSAASILGGVVCDNQGKIVSSQFNGTISAYSSSLLSDQINTAGFAVSNSGEISMCFVGSKTLSLSFDTAGSMGGFVYSNSGTIYDCYLSNVSFSSRGKIAGFVYTSTGKVFRCYVYSLSTLQGDRSKDAFCYEKTSGKYQDCYFMVQENFNSTVDGVESISILDMLKEDKYSNFNFSEDNFGVWSMTNTGPALNSCYTLQGEKPTIEDGDKITFIVSGSREIPYLIYNDLWVS